MRADYETLAAANTLATRREQLNHVLGRDVSAPVAVSPLPERAAHEEDLAAAQARAVESRPEAREARLRAARAAHDAAVTRSEYAPDVSLTLRYASLRNFDQVLPENFSSAGFLLTWEPWDWGRKRFELREQRRTEDPAWACGCWRWEAPWGSPSR
jgi:outer membrane protein TolC